MVLRPDLRRGIEIAYRGNDQHILNDRLIERCLGQHILQIRQMHIVIRHIMAEHIEQHLAVRIAQHQGLHFESRLLLKR
ncbi:hypothetical protein D3C76_87870 [compost metagenome]